MDYFEFNREYVDRLLGGDIWTEEHFANYFGHTLRIKIRSRLHSEQDMEDVLQEVLTRVLRSLREFGIRRPECLGAFVHAVCDRVLLEFFRKRIYLHVSEAPEMREPGMNIEQQMLKEEAARAIWTLMEELSDRDRGILRAVFLEERDKDEVCADYRVSRDYLRVLMHRARRRLRDLMEAEKDSHENAIKQPLSHYDQ